MGFPAFAFPRPRYVMLAKFDADVVTFLKATGLEPKPTSAQAPWQNGVAERWIGSCRREILDHVIAVNEVHLRRLIRDYVTYYRADRIHNSLEKDAPNRRPIEPKPSPTATVIASPRLAGLHIGTLGGKQRSNVCDSWQCTNASAAAGDRCRKRSKASEESIAHRR